MKKILTVAVPFILLTLASSAGPPAPGLPEVVIHANDTFTGFKTRPTAPSATFQMEFGDTLGSAVVEIVPAPGDVRDLKVQVQIETSLTIMDDGPHLDLTDWKHHTSPWIDLERIAGMQFRLPTLEGDPGHTSTFPAYTVDELYEAALALGGQRWADIGRQWPNPEDGRVAVGISSVRIRVVTQDTANTLFTLQVPIPMGC